MASAAHDTQEPQSLQAGRVGRAHGLDGSFYVTGAQPRLLALGMKLTVADTPREIVHRAGVDKRPIVRLAGVEDRSTVEALRGLPLTVPRMQAPALPAGEWWAHELENCAVFDAGRYVGIVKEMLELPSCEVLRVLRDDRGELLVPMISDAIRDIDTHLARIDIDLAFLGEAEV